MRTRKIIVISIAVAFLLITVLAVLTMFSLRKAEVNYAVDKDTDSGEIQQVLDGFLGKNLLFFDEQEVVDALKPFNYIEVLSVEKDYPNVLKVSVKERREVYYFEHQNKLYVTNEDGFLLNCLPLGTEINTREMIELKLSNVKILDVTLGKIMETDSPVLMTTVFEMAKSANLTDCIKAMSVIKPAAGEMSDVHISTHTGVNIVIQKVDEYGQEKIRSAFSAYDEKINDFEKGFGTLLVGVVNGEIKVTWSGNTDIG